MARRPRPTGERRAHPDPVRVVHLDDWLIVVDKPSGLPTHATTDPARPHLHGAVIELRRAAGEDDPYVGVHHRLDVDTSGLVLFTIDRSVNAAVGAAFADRAVEKGYVAVVTGDRPPLSWEVRDHLAPIGKVGRVTRHGAVRAGGKIAHSSFRLLGPAPGPPGRWLVEGRPHTGRTHQLRVHLAGGGNPIVGDRLYGGVGARRVALHAARLRIPHPVTGEPLEVTAPPPPDLGR